MGSGKALWEGSRALGARFKRSERAAPDSRESRDSPPTRDGTRRTQLWELIWKTEYSRVISRILLSGWLTFMSPK